ncbi:uncharacterized protein E0L32_009304 [Thyridium curvatum]|uniref:Uncharacterized protein n=1 Tax=Thyridium curvatum TaxID=1093900 RepID=A0A507AXA9_9PEZI|nr:uncharacterized protein E0L32_009304 [Thyridium curvatum]TPX09561.1 hypothetical protein E0L32_009304 [Thyridium curvatum]
MEMLHPPESKALPTDCEIWTRHSSLSLMMASLGSSWGFGLLAIILPNIVLQGGWANVFYIEPPSYPAILSISASGNGCPQGTPYFVPAPNGTLDWDDWTLVMPNFTARDGLGSDPTERTKNCQTHLNLAEAPTGWQVTLRGLTARGYVRLDPEATVQALGTVYWSQDPTAASFTWAPAFTSCLLSDMQQATTKNVTLKADSKMEGPATIELRWDTDGPGIWTPCDTPGQRGGHGILNVNFRVVTRGTENGGEAYFGNYGDHFVTEKLDWMWRPCTVHAPSMSATPPASLSGLPTTVSIPAESPTDAGTSGYEQDPPSKTLTTSDKFAPTSAEMA